MSNDFKYLDELIHSGVERIILKDDIILNDNKVAIKYFDGINIDIDNIVIDGNGHFIDAENKIRIFKISGKNITLKNITVVFV